MCHLMLHFVMYNIFSLGAKKGAAPAAGKGKAEPAKPKERVWGPKDDAARKIQTKYRQYRSKKALEKLKKEKEEYEELMDKTGERG